MSDMVIVETVRPAVGKRRGGLAYHLAPDIFSDIFAGLIDRAGVGSDVVGQVTGGCVSQVGQQSGNVTRSAWLAAGLDRTVGASTDHAQCGSSQQAFTLAHGLLASDTVDVAVAGGVESMDQVPMTSSVVAELDPAKTPRYEAHYEITTQFEVADRIAESWGSTRRQFEEHAGNESVMMPTGPSPATRKLLERNGLAIDGMDVFEINEAFAPCGARLGARVEAGHGSGEPQRGCDRPRPSAWRHRRRSPDEGAQRGRADPRTLWPGGDVRQRRHGDGDQH